MSCPSWEGKAAVLASMWASRSLSTSRPLAGREASGTDRAATRVDTDSGLLRRGNLQAGQTEIIYAYNRNTKAFVNVPLKVPSRWTPGRFSTVLRPSYKTYSIVAHSCSRKLFGRSNFGLVFHGKYLLLAELSASWFKLFSACRPDLKFTVLSFTIRPYSIQFAERSQSYLCLVEFLFFTNIFVSILGT